MLHRLPMITLHPSHGLSHSLSNYAEVLCVSNILHLWLRLPFLFSSRLANRSCTHCNCCHLVHTASCCCNTTATSFACPGARATSKRPAVLVPGPHPSALLPWCHGHIQMPCCPGARATCKRPTVLVLGPHTNTLLFWCQGHTQMPCPQNHVK